jgi:hypothetical protein
LAIDECVGDEITVVIFTVHVNLALPTAHVDLSVSTHLLNVYVCAARLGVCVFHIDLRDRVYSAKEILYSVEQRAHTIPESNYLNS